MLTSGQRLLFAAAAVVVSVAPAIATPVFTVYSGAQGSMLSGNGQVVAGTSDTWFRTINGVRSNIPVTSGANWGIARGINTDGSVVVGGLSMSPSGYRAAVWTQGVGTSLLPNPAGIGTVLGSEAIATNASGSIIVGSAYNGTSSFGVRWVNGVAEALPGVTLGGSNGRIVINGAGDVIAGTSGQARPFVFTDSGTVTLPTGGAAGGVFGISSDGHVVTGYISSLGTVVRWVEGVSGWTMEPLSSPPITFAPNGMTADGSVVVGRSGFYGAVWIQGVGLTYLHLLLPQLGVDLGGRRLDTCDGISADGTTLYGHCWSPLEGDRNWILTGLTSPIPTPAATFVLAPAAMVFMRRRRA